MLGDTSGQVNQQSQLKRALAALKALRARLEEVERSHGEPIAVVGMGCRFPGGVTDPESYWELLRSGVDAVRPVPSDRWDADAFYDPDPDAPGKMITRSGGFISDVDRFDPHFFGISPREAASMDPQQRLLLEVVWEALERAGQPPDRLVGSLTGVFVGISTNDYSRLFADCIAADPHTGTGNAFSVAAGRLSYTLGLQGPSLAVDTACSSSLVAVHLACQALHNRDCDLALAAGVNLTLSPMMTVYFSKLRVLSPSGRCKTFDASADGYVRGEGCGAVVLKRLSDAHAAGETPWATIRGSAVNHAGRSNGLTAPNGQAQRDVIRRALKLAGIPPERVGYVEAHGTGTPLGDPVELQALAEAVDATARRGRPLWVGSAKTNIGHLESAAGIAGLIKTVLCLHHGQIPPHLHLTRPNPHLPWGRLALAVPTGTARPWPDGDAPRVAGVSSFGFSGTNAHIVLEQAAAPMPTTTTTTGGPRLLVLSAKGEPALRALAGRYASALAANPSPNWDDVCAATATGRAQLPDRLSLVADTPGHAAERLLRWQLASSSTDVSTGRTAPGRRPRLALLIPGQGAQFTGMGRQLYDDQPVFRNALRQCHDWLGNTLPLPLLAVLGLDGTVAPAGLLDRTSYAQPALVAMAYALQRLWLSWGVEPDAVLGHSVGEIAAACVAGVLDWEAGLRLAAERGRLMDETPGEGAMLAVAASQAAVAAELETLALAAINGPEAVVLSGPRVAIAAAAARLASRGIATRPLNSAYAFHSPLIAPAVPGLQRAAAGLVPRPAAIALVSNLTGDVVGGTEMDAAYWGRHARETVQFAAGLETLLRRGCRLFVELGPGTTLIGLGRRSHAASEGSWLASLRRGHDERRTMLESLGALWTAGTPVAWTAVYPGRRRVSLPTYPFQRERCWGDHQDRGSEPTPAMAAQDTTGARVDAVATSPPEVSPDDLFYEVRWRPQQLPNPAGQDQPTSWLLLSDQGGLGAALATRLQARGEEVMLLPREPHEDRLVQIQGLLDEFMSRISTPALAVVYLWECEAVDPDRSQEMTSDPPRVLADGDLLHVIRGLLQVNRAGSPRVRLWMVTRGAQSVVPGSGPVAVSQAPLWGVSRVLALEHPELRGTCVDLDPSASTDQAASALLEEIGSQARGDDQVAYRGTDRFVAMLIRAPECNSPAKHFSVRADATYLITGGLGGLGLQVAQWLADRGAAHLLLLSRRPPDDRCRSALDRLTDRGVYVHVALADVVDAGALEVALHLDRHSRPPLRGVIHAAGQLDDGLIADLDFSRMAAVMGPKVAGAWNLHQFTRHHELDFFVMFSSLASILGSPGQAAYAAGNAFLDALAAHRRAEGLPAQTINWGPWSGPGMTLGLSDQHQRQWVDYGIDQLAPVQGLEALGRVMSGSGVQVMVASLDWVRILGQLPGGVPRMLEEIARAVISESGGEKTPPRRSALIDILRGLPEDRRAEVIGVYLQQQIATIMKVELEQVPQDRNMLEFGLDSLSLMEMLHEFRRDFGMTLYPREIYERPTIAAMSRYLAAEIARTNRASDAGPAPTLPEAAEAPTLPREWDLAVRIRSYPRPKTRLPGIIFLLGSPRSGTTLLRVMLAGHPELFCPPELHLLPFAGMADRQTTLGPLFLGEGLPRALLELGGSGPEESKALVDDLVSQDMPIQMVYALLQERAGGRRLVDKSPSYAASPDVLERAEHLFLGSKYIHLVRHPYAAIDSFVRNRMDRLIGGTDADPELLAEQLWARCNRNIVEFLSRLDPRHHQLIHFEDLVADPVQVMDRLCAFLEVPFDRAVLKPYEGRRMTDGLGPRSLPIGDPNFLEHDTIDARLGEAWKRIQLQRPLGTASWQLAIELGYDLPHAPEPTSDALTSRLAPADRVMVEEYLDIRGLSLCVCSWGPADGRLVLCLHGILDQGASWEEVALPLADRGFRVVAPDLRGHGRSGHVGVGGSYQLIDFVADVDAIARRLGDTPFTLVGHSMGAALAVLYAAARPERVSALILVESLLPSQRPRAEAAEQLVTHLDSLNATLEHPVFPDVESAARRQRQGVPGLSEERALRLARRITEPTGGGVRWRWDVTIQSRAGIAFHGLLDGDLAHYRQILGQVRPPVTLVNGAQSRMTSAETIQVHRESLVVVREVSLEGGHHLLIDAPGPLAEIIAEAALRIHCAAILSAAGPDLPSNGAGPIPPPQIPRAAAGGSSEKFAGFPPEQAIPDSLSRVEP